MPVIRTTWYSCTGRWVITQEQSVQLELTLTLPDTLAREAKAQGLLTAETLEDLIRAEVQRRRVAQLFVAADRLAAIPEFPLTETEIEAEIQALRDEKRGIRARRR